MHLTCDTCNQSRPIEVPMCNNGCDSVELPNPRMVADHELNHDPLCKQMTVETFEQVVDKPMTPLEREIEDLTLKVFNHPNGGLIFRKFLHRLLDRNIQELEDNLNEVVSKHPMVDDALTVYLDIKTRD